MPLQVYDHEARAKRTFEPIEPGKVGLYVCGLTVQDRPHLGHMYAFVACDMVRRYLEHIGYEVTHVQNFTDIDDKIIERARSLDVSVAEVAEQNIAAYREAAEALAIKPAHHYPRVTEHIPEIVAFIARLVERDHAYASGGDVYFRVRSYAQYGRLSGRDLDEMRTGVRVAVGDRKEDPLDFVLWKAVDGRGPGWDSPWGRGRPGWHIECSAMATRYLGDHFDFHGGGRDLLFPHHENELAQSCCATGSRYVNHWLHNGLVYLGKSKMSKSDGNFLAMETLLDRYPATVLRFFLLNAHFRSHLDFSEDRLQEAASGYARLQRGTQRVLLAVAEATAVDSVSVPAGLISGPGLALIEAAAVRRRRFFAAMDDDFNSGAAIGELFGLVRELNHYLAATDDRGLDPGALAACRDLLLDADGILGLFPAGVRIAADAEAEPPSTVSALASRRDDARRRRDWGAADSLRAEIRKFGWDVVDTRGGSRLQPEFRGP